MTGISVLVLLLILGVLIIAHEFGHFVAARRNGVRVNEFAIGMGPVLWSRDEKTEDGTPGTRFTIRAFPIGGFCAMEGEDSPSEVPDAFNQKKISRRFVILVAGSVLNFLLGVVILGIYHAPFQSFAEPVIESIHEKATFGGENGLQAGDRLLLINGNPVFLQNDVGLFLEREEGNPIDITVWRDGKMVSFKNLPMVKQDIDGRQLYGFSFTLTEATVLKKAEITFLTALDYTRLVWYSLGELISGRAGMDEMMGPVGMGGVVDEIVKEERIPLSVKVLSLLNLAALIAVNLAVFNLLPLPALDGGRILFLIVEAVLGRPVNRRFEGYVHAVGMALFLGLMVFVLYNDITRLIKG